MIITGSIAYTITYKMLIFAFYFSRDTCNITIKSISCVRNDKQKLMPMATTKEKMLEKIITCQNNWNKMHPHVHCLPNILYGQTSRPFYKRYWTLFHIGFSFSAIFKMQIIFSISIKKCDRVKKTISCINYWQLQTMQESKPILWLRHHRCWVSGVCVSQPIVRKNGQQGSVTRGGAKGSLLENKNASCSHV